MDGVEPAPDLIRGDVPTIDLVRHRGADRTGFAARLRRGGGTEYLPHRLSRRRIKDSQLFKPAEANEIWTAPCLCC
jgi:hypothetical protein